MSLVREWAGHVGLGRSEVGVHNCVDAPHLQPDYIDSVPFYSEVALLGPAGANLLYLTMANGVGSLDAARRRERRREQW
jgi:hypothetical protein